MRAAVFHGRGDIRVEEVPDPAPGRGELLVRIHASGICGTDAHEYAHGPSMFPIDGPHPVTGHSGPLIPGHELSGTVAAVGDDVSGFADGEFVVSGAGISCGECVPCRRGRTNLCLHYASVGLQRHGGLAQYCAVPAATCLAVDTDVIPPDAATLAQPMAIAVHAMRRGRLDRSGEAVIVGAGGIGAFLTYAAAATGAPVKVIDLHPGRLRLAEALGADQVWRPQPGVDVRRALDLRPGYPTVVYEVSGSRAGLATALAALPPGGCLVQVSLHDAPSEIALRDLALREQEIVGTNAHVYADDLPTALRLLAARQAPWDDIAPVAIGLDQLVPEGLDPLVRGSADRIKTLVDPWIDGPRPTRMS